MDHKWGRTITEKGLGDLGATMAARYLVGSGERYILNRLIPGQGAYSVTITGGGQINVNIPILPWPPAAPHFPYGLAVEPDAPV